MKEIKEEKKNNEKKLRKEIKKKYKNRTVFYPEYPGKFKNFKVNILH